MRQTWYIENLASEPGSSKGQAFKTNIPNPATENGLTIFLDGYVLPMMQHYEGLCHLEPLDLIQHLWMRHGREFIHYLKGVFCIVLLKSEGFEIYTDRHGINNFFTYRQGSKYVISNSLEEISSRVKLEPDPENAAVFTLLSHFIGPATPFANVANSEAGTFLKCSRGELTPGRYWQPEELVKKGRNVAPHGDGSIAQAWKELAGQYLAYLKPAGVSLTITAGNDSRMVLAALLAQGESPHTFTFGNPASYENVVSTQVANAAGVSHSVHFVETPDAAWMEKRSRELIGLGSGMVSIQRAHRLDAYAKEKATYPANEMLFTGLMGGEYIKMPPPNSAALPRLLKLATNPNSEDELARIIYEVLRSRGFRAENVDVSEVGRKIKALVSRAEGFTPRERDFLLLYLFYGCAHHTQEARVLGSLFRFPVHLFMDIDFLQMLASSDLWYPNNHQPYNRLTHSWFLVAATHQLAPQLSRVPYGKRGQYTAEDMLLKPGRYLWKRLRYLLVKEKKLHPVGFLMGRWMHDFCSGRLNELNDRLDQLFYVDQLKAYNDRFIDGTGEYQWQLLTNPINLGMAYDHYTQA